MAAAITMIVLGLGEALAVAATLVAMATTFVLTTVATGGATLPVVTTALAAAGPGVVATLSSIAASACALFATGMAELFKKEKTFKLFAIRGSDCLLLPLLGSHSDLEKFPAQARYETEVSGSKEASFDDIEKMMYILGSRIYAKQYFTKTGLDHYSKPTFDSSEQEIRTQFILKITAQNVEYFCGEYSIERLNEMFRDQYGIMTNNFITNGPTTWEGEYKFSESIENGWKENSDERQLLSVQSDISETGRMFCVSKEEFDNVDKSKCTIDSGDITDDFLKNVALSIRYDSGNNYFFYHESNKDGSAINYNEDPDTDN